ncbi:MAG: alkaline phosphatase [Rikenellaceae bacterium]|jgi:alkaline phosphatase|nr:alkaline phosphatase [Rikenellaceae bacterium]
MKNIRFLLSTFLALAVVSVVAARDPKVHNIIFMVGDGMGVTQLTSAMLRNSWQPLNMERAQAVGLVKTCSANNTVTDSAAAGTALATGHKTDNKMISQGPDGTKLETIAEKARRKGMSTGLVVTSYITDATPAVFYAHAGNRNEHQNIALQLVESGAEVFMGGGNESFTDRRDKRDLAAELATKGYTVARNIDEAMKTASGRLAGLMCNGYMPRRDKRGDYLPRATAKTLELLSQNKKGFFALIEGSQIDLGGHAADAETVIGETLDFDAAVKVAFDFADRTPGTLVVIVADHETGGMAIVPNNADFTAGESGVAFAFAGSGGASKSHTAAMVPLLAYGAGAKEFSRIMDNTEVNRIMCRLLGVE